jgi:hypothetical protein
MSTAVSSHWAPAAGCVVTPGIPMTTRSHSWSSATTASAPCARSSGWNGWIAAKPGMRAISSFSFGLYFMVQEPSG